MNKENIVKYQDQELNEINNYIEKLDYENAKMLLIKKLNSDHDNIEALDILSEVLISLDQVEEAKEVKIK